MWYVRFVSAVSWFLIISSTISCTVWAVLNVTSYLKEMWQLLTSPCYQFPVNQRGIIEVGEGYQLCREQCRCFVCCRQTFGSIVNVRFRLVPVLYCPDSHVFTYIKALLTYYAAIGRKVLFSINSVWFLILYTMQFKLAHKTQWEGSVLSVWRKTWIWGL
jgi:hypothetical protein